MELIPYSKNGVSFLVVKNIYDAEELFLIQKELDFLWYGLSFSRDKKYLSTAILEDGTMLADRSGLWLDFFYKDRESSLILRLNRKPYRDNTIREAFSKLNPYHYHYLKLNADGTLLQYYEESDYYKPHSDLAVFSLVTWFCKEPKKFVGGNFKFTDLDITIEIENNMTVIFPSFLRHEVEEVKMLETDKFNPLGRFSMTQFFVYDYNK